MPPRAAVFVQNFTKDVGLVVGVPVAVRAENDAGRIEAYLINGHARLLLTASVLGLGFGVGKTMRCGEAISPAPAGSPPCRMLAEDTAIAMDFARKGLKTVFCHGTVAQEIGAELCRNL